MTSGSRYGRLQAALAAAEAREHARDAEREETGARLREVFRERAIALGTMDRGLRLVTGVALLQIVAVAALVGLRDTAMPTVALNTTSGEQTLMAAPTFWITVVSLSLAWAYGLGGLLHGHRIARLGALCLFTGAVYALWDLPVPLATPRMVPSYLILAAVWAVGLNTLRRAPEEREGPRRLRLATIGVLWLLGIALYLAFWWRLQPLRDERFFTLAVFHQLQIASFALIPVLFVAGVDFAEWGDAASSRAAILGHRLRSPLWLGLLAFLAAAGALAYRLDVTPTGRFARELGLGAVFLLLVLGLATAARLRRPLPARVPYVVVFASSVLLYGLLLGVSYAGESSARASSTLALRHATPPRFQLDYPLSWQLLPQETKVGIHVFGVSAPEQAAQLLVFAVPADVAAALGDDLRARFFKGPVTDRRREGPWQVTDFRLPGKQARAWQRRVGNDVWLLVGWTSPSAFPSFASTFEEIASSWTSHAPSGAETETSAAVAERNRVTVADRAVEVASLTWLALALAAAVFLAVLTVRRLPRPGWLVGGVLFVLAAGLLFVLVQLPTLGLTVLGLSRTALPQLDLGGLQGVVAVATLLLLAWLALRRPRPARTRELLALLFVANAGLLAIYWVDRGFAGGIATGGRFSIVQAVLVVAALVWDILMSGEAVTNRHSRHFPRHTRVLVYLGYVMLVATAVLFFSSLRIQATNASIEPQFESEGYVEDGLLFLGTSLLVTLFALRLSRLRARA